jgi:hypothetical protein
MLWILFGLLAFVAAGLFAYLGTKQRGEFDRIKTYVPVDTIKTIPQEIPVIIRGKVIAETPLTAPLSQKPCIFYRYELQKQETVQEGTGTKTVWKTVSTDEQRIPFYLKDNSGQILIKPDGSHIDGVYTTEKMLEPGTLDNPELQKHPLLASVVNIAVNIGKPQERAYETAIFTETELTVFGILSLEGEELFFQNTPYYPMILTTKSREQMIAQEGKTSTSYYLLAVALFVIGIILLGVQTNLF